MMRPTVRYTTVTQKFSGAPVALSPEAPARRGIRLLQNTNLVTLRAARGVCHAMFEVLRQHDKKKEC